MPAEFLQCLQNKAAPNSAIPRAHLGASVSHLQTTVVDTPQVFAWNVTEAPQDPQGA